MRSGKIPYYDRYDSYDFPQKNPFNKITYGSQKEYIKKWVSGEPVFEENELWTNPVLWRVR